MNPGGLVFHVKKSTSFRKMFIQEGLLIDFPCGGKGLCSQCRIRIDPPTESGKGGKKPLPDAEVKKGIRLACRAVVEGDCRITIPEGKEIEKIWRDPAQAEGTHLLSGESLIKRKHIKLPKPTLEDQRADWERLKDCFETAGHSVSQTQISSLESFSNLMRENNWEADAILEEDSLLCLCSNLRERIYGFAIDLGTTTVDVSLHDLETGRRVARKTLLNKQTAFGADVISRAVTFQSNREDVRRAALDTIREGAEMILKEKEISPKQVVRSVVVGNPIMIHILHDLNPRQLTCAPYIPLISEMIRRRPEEFCWHFQQYGFVDTLPLISAFVGADTIGLILALDLEHDPRTSLSIDIGTNGEIVLAQQGKIFTTSTAAGPAFEGAQISCGMRAATGAINSVSISKTGTLEVKVIGDSQPKGFCGSGLISCIAELLDTGVLDSTGRLLEPEEIDSRLLKKRIIRVDNQKVFLVSPEKNIFISQKDIRELQLAKGAIRTGIDMLLIETGVRVDEIKRIRLAGNFGTGIDIKKAMRLGLIPEVAHERVDVVGNAALRGAALALVSRNYSNRSSRVQKQCRFFELAGKPDFQMRFTQSMFFK